MKKNALSHMQPPKETVGSWFKRHQIFSRMLCLLLALIIWLAVYHATKGPEEVPQASIEAVDPV